MYPSLRYNTLLLVIMTFGFLAGCAETAPARHTFASGDFARTRIASSDTERVERAAEKAFRVSYRVDQEESGMNLWVSNPEEVTQHEPERVSDVLSISSRRHRRIAYLQVLPEGNGTLVRCRVVMQRLDTAERSAFARSRNYDGDDRPGDTPIDRAGSASTSTHEEWVNVGRDREAEQTLLRSIEQELGPASTTE